MRPAAIVTALLAVAACASDVAGQPRYRAAGQEIVPAYEGWERNADGSHADTTAGILAWLLEQRPVQALCTSNC